MTNNFNPMKLPALPWRLHVDGRFQCNRPTHSTFAMIYGLASTAQHADEHKHAMRYIEIACNNHIKLAIAAERFLHAVERIDKTFQNLPIAQADFESCTKELNNARTELEDILANLATPPVMSEPEKPSQPAKEKIQFKKWNCLLERAEYDNGRLALTLVDLGGETVARCTVNMPEVTLDEDEIIIKDYAENDGMVEALIKADIIFPPHRFIEKQFPTHMLKVPVARLYKTK